MLLAISLAACTSVPRFAPVQPWSPADAAPSPSTAADRAGTEPLPEPTASQPAPECLDTTGEKRSYLTELGKGVVLVTLFALLVWLQYRAIYPYPDAR